MTIKIRFHPDKAIIRWKTPGDREFLKQQMTMFRDSQIAKISVKDERGREVPRILMKKPEPTGPIVVDKKDIQIISEPGGAISSTEKSQS